MGILEDNACQQPIGIGVTSDTHGFVRPQVVDIFTVPTSSFIRVILAGLKC